MKIDIDLMAINLPFDASRSLPRRAELIKQINDFNSSIDAQLVNGEFPGELVLDMLNRKLSVLGNVEGHLEHLLLCWNDAIRDADREFARTITALTRKLQRMGFVSRINEILEHHPATINAAEYKRSLFACDVSNLRYTVTRLKRKALSVIEGCSDKYIK